MAPERNGHGESKVKETDGEIEAQEAQEISLKER